LSTAQAVKLADQHAMGSYGRIANEIRGEQNAVVATKLAILTAAAQQRGQNNAVLAAAARAEEGQRARDGFMGGKLSGIEAATERVAAKNFSPSVSVRVTAVTNLTVSSVLRTITSSWIAASATGAGPALSESAL
jgi:hypothetical protein